MDIRTYTVTPLFAPLSEGKPLSESFHLKLSVPGSKSLTNRALMLAALADGETVLEGIGLSDDSRHFIRCLEDLGFSVTLHEKPAEKGNPVQTSSHDRIADPSGQAWQEEAKGPGITICGQSGRIPRQNVSINVGSAGTAARFLTAMLGCSHGTWHLTSSEQMKRRPMKELLQVLLHTGCAFSFEEEEWHFPFTISSAGLQAEELSVNIEKSSQFLSALLMAAVVSEKDIRILAEGNHGLAYVRMTEKLMEMFGCGIQELQPRSGDEAALCFAVKGGCLPRAGIYRIEPDVSAACYFYAMAAISGGTVLVEGVHKDTLQGDIAFLRLLEEMGCSMEDLPEGIRLTGPEGGRLHGVSADLSSFSDQALTLAAIAPFANSPVTITGVSHIRGQECDRIKAILENLRRIGIQVRCTPDDTITIWPGCPSPALIETYGDHRVAMSFALTGLRSPGITIKDPLCCRKTFEQYFNILDGITCQSA